MHISFWGAAQTVTGSQHLLEVGGSQVLLDCGLFQGRRSDADSINRVLPFSADRIEAMVLSHGHIDHTGNIPNLVKSGFGGRIFATSATSDLCKNMLLDSAHIQESDAAFMNKRGARPTVLPIYTQMEATRSLNQFSNRDFDRPFAVTSSVRATFSEAGHMLGSAHELLELSEGGRTVRMCFSGDLGRVGLPILRDPAPMPDAEVLVIEGTYGNRLHEPIETAAPALLTAIQDTVRRGGKIVIPAFAVGRTQEVVYFLNELVQRGALPNVPVYVDSPLAVNVTEVFRAHPECFDAETNALLHNDPDGNAFGFSRLKYVRTVDESKALNDVHGPCVIISASGMCEAGRVLHHLRNVISDPKNMVLLVSFQAPNTLGRRLIDKVPTVRILGDEFQVRAEVRQLNGFSGHADRNDLLKWVTPQVKNLRKVFIVHAEMDAATALAEGFHDLGIKDVTIPAKGQGFEL